MSEKLDLFEKSVKQGLENYEVPMEDGAWNQFQMHMTKGSGSSSSSTGSKGSSFFGKFGLAAAVLSAAGLFINYGTDLRQDELSHDSTNPTGEVTAASDTHGVSSESSTDYLVSVPITNEADQAADNTNLASNKVSDTALENSTEAKAEDKRIININKKLQEAADRAEQENAALEKKTTTRFVGKNFNLNAASEFSPDGDNKEDYFLPSALTAEDRFTMTVTSASGKKIFSSTQLDKPWTGETADGKPAAEGHYSWEVVLYKDKHTTEIFRGVVKLER